jgi:hypothetical protein
MPISDGEWESIRRLVSRLNSKRGEEIVTGQVVKSDRVKNLVYLKEFGTQPIPMVAQDYDVSYYDTQYTLVGGVLKAVTVKKQCKVSLKIPVKGDTVVVLREWGTSRLPRCLGRLYGAGWMTEAD